MRVSVTGANGLLGAHVVRALVTAGHDPVAVVRQGADLRGLNGLDVPLARADTRSGTTSPRRSTAQRSSSTAPRSTPTRARSRNSSARTSTALAASSRPQRRRGPPHGAHVVFGDLRVEHRPTTGRRDRTDRGRVGAALFPYQAAAGGSGHRGSAGSRGRAGRLPARRSSSVGRTGGWCRATPSSCAICWTRPARRSPAGATWSPSATRLAGRWSSLSEAYPGERYLLGGEDCSWRTVHSLISELTGTGGPHLTGSRNSAWLGASAAEALARLTSRPPLATRDEARTVGRWYWYASRKAAELGYTARSARATVAGALAWLVTSPHVPRLVREGLTLADEVYAAHELVASPLPSSRVVPSSRAPSSPSPSVAV